MGDITALAQLDFAYIFISVLTALAGIKAAVTLVEWAVDRMGIETRSMRRKREDHELLVRTADRLSELYVRHNELVDRDLEQVADVRREIGDLSEKVGDISDTLKAMKRKNEETKLRELKDTLVRYYNRYRAEGRWTSLESDAFWDLYQDYDARGGDGFIHTVVEPAMRELEIVD